MSRGRRSSGPLIAPGRRQLANVVAFLAGGAVVLAYALLGGSYDILVFEGEAVVIWALIAVGFAFGQLPRARPGRSMVVMAALLLAFTAWTALSLAWTDSSQRSMEEVARCLAYLGLIVLVASCVDRDSWPAAARGMILAALLVSLGALISRLAPGSFFPDPVGAALGADRLSYPLGYWNAVAAWGAMATTLGLGWSGHERRLVPRGICLALLPAASTATYLTYSRAGIGETALGVLVLLAVSRNRFTVAVHAAAAAAAVAVCVLVVRSTPAIAHGNGTAGGGRVLVVMVVASGFCAAVGLATGLLGTDRARLPARLSRGLCLIALVALLALAAGFGPTLASRAWRSFNRPVDSSQTQDPTTRLLNLSGNRINLWKAAIHAFDARPGEGTGAGTFAFWWNAHATDPEFTQDAHSIWFQDLAELGLPGGLLILGTLASGVVLAVVVRRRSRRSRTVGLASGGLAATVVFIAAASVDWMWEVPAVTALALGGLALLGARLSAPVGRVPWTLRGGMVLFAIVAALVQLPGLISTAELRDSQGASRNGDPTQALADANAAVSAEPWAASPYEQRALVEEADGRLAAAAEDERRAILREPDNYAHWLVLARIQTERDQLGDAVHDLAVAHRLRPLSAAFVYSSSLSQSRTGTGG